MSTRLLIQLAETGSVAMPESIKGILEGAGAEMIRASHPELPGLYTAIVPEGTEVAALVTRLMQSPWVRNAEEDAMRGTL